MANLQMINDKTNKMGFDLNEIFKSQFSSPRRIQTILF